MRILLTGATGYVGRRLLPLLVEEGHHVVCCVRDKSRFSVAPSLESAITVIEVDFLVQDTLSVVPTDIDMAYYLIHSMSASADFKEDEAAAANNFLKATAAAERLRQVVYLTGIVNHEGQLSEHLESRYAVERILSGGDFAFTALRAGIIIGSGSASFEIIRDLVEKLPVLITPKWVRSKCQPIAIRDVLSFLVGVACNESCYDQVYDIYGPDILTYKEMMMTYAAVRDMKRYVVEVPVMTPRLSSYWLYFMTSTTYNLAVALVDSMKVDVVAKPNSLAESLGIRPLTYKEALRAAFIKIKQNAIVSSWKDSFVSGAVDIEIGQFVEVPEFGCFRDVRSHKINDVETTTRRLWEIGGDKGWYYADSLWKLRGFIDKLFGGVGLRRGRTHRDRIDVGDAIDFWRVLYADRERGRLLLYAEMLLPGDAWLEFCIEDGYLQQKATFRPKGLMGRLYWYSVLPFHGLIFKGMLRALTA